MVDTTDSGNIVSRTFLHSAYVPNAGNDTDALVVSEIVETDKGEVFPNLKVYQSPVVPFWTTQSPYRNHTNKKEFESVKRLDEHRVRYKDKDREIFKIFNGFYPNFLSYKQKKALYSNPFLYGANLDIGALVAMKYKKDLGDRIPQIGTTGFFDIERSLLRSSLGKLPLMVYTHENKVFLAMKKSFMYEERNGKHVEVTLDEIVKATHDVIDPLIASIFADNKDLKEYGNKLPFSYEFFVGETEVDMIKWIFGKMHECKTTFIGIWNLDFDIPVILQFLEENNVPLSEVFCDPSLRGTGFAYVNYRDDKRDVAHFTQKWHWLTATAHFLFIDSMALYSYARVVDGKETSYKLDYILKKHGVGGKLKIGDDPELDGLQEADWHRAMLSKHFVNYALYTLWDGISLQLMEWINKDLSAMLADVDVTPLKFYPNQTIKATSTLYEEWLPRGEIVGTGTGVGGVIDEELITSAGAVLAPKDLVANGVRLFEDWPEHYTHCYFWQNDLDFSAQYPTNLIVLNISKQSKISTIGKIIGEWLPSSYTQTEAVDTLCSYLITPQANGYNLGTEYFGLPTYSDMDEAFKKSMAA